MIYDKLASAIRNDIVGGLKGYHQNQGMNLDQLKDDITDERLQIIKEYQLKGVLPKSDLMLSINCIPVDCQYIEKCPECVSSNYGTPTAHCEIPLLLNDYGIESIQYIGSIDKQVSFNFYLDPQSYNFYHKYRRRGKNNPTVLIDCTPNKNGMYDCWIFNAPLIKTLSITAIFKDPRLLELYSCCNDFEDDNFSWINNEIKKRLTMKKLLYYRLYSPALKPNDQTYSEA